MAVSFYAVAALLAASPASSALISDEECVKTASGAYICSSAKRLAPPKTAAEAKTAGGVSEQVTKQELDATRQVPKEAPQATPQPVRATATEAMPRRAQLEKGQYASAYGGFGQAVFLRGGYGFAGSDNGAGGEVRGAVLAAGFRSALKKKSKNQISVEAEVVYVGDNDETGLPGAIVETKVTGVTGLVSLRWDASPEAALNPFASVGVGPAHYRMKTTTSTAQTTASETSFGYSARAGVEAALGDQVSIEAAYRFLGAAQTNAVSIHAAEIGVNYEF